MLRDLIAMMILKIAVEVGFVDGMIAATTPRGLAISTMLPVSLTTPTVLRSAKVVPDILGRKAVLLAFVLGLAKTRLFVGHLAQAGSIRAGPPATSPRRSHRSLPDPNFATV